VVAYLDSSVILRHILMGEIAIHHALACNRVVASELVEIECRRVIHRYRMDGNLSDDGFVSATDRLRSVMTGITLLALTSSVKQRAMGAFPVTVKTLDALHLATALAFADSLPGESLLMFSHDTVLNRCAVALGFAAPLSQ
jgi:predicted nucleic acid-binding protein